jgi:uncharacterized lipoprotein YehR (DUF1307 family)
MKLTNVITLSITTLVFSLGLMGCGDKISAVDSGTYEGSIAKVNPPE